ncbi:UNVERIFIED_CONTAM: hypothetical protein HHA_216120 [Hammondia hammondi]|eukprot:XP_008886354.1 hypothetical protein HHA_216120 [Hammondia hammondi]
MTAQRQSGSTAPLAAKATGSSQKSLDGLPVFCLLHGDNESGPYLPLGMANGDGRLNSAFFYDAKAHVLKEIGLNLHTPTRVYTLPDSCRGLSEGDGCVFRSGTAASIEATRTGKKRSREGHVNSYDTLRQEGDPPAESLTCILARGQGLHRLSAPEHGLGNLALKDDAFLSIEEDIVHVAPLPAIRRAGSKGGSGMQLCLAVTSAATRAPKQKDGHSECQVELRCHLVSCSPFSVLASCTVGQCPLRAALGERGGQVSSAQRKKGFSGHSNRKNNPSSAYHVAVSNPMLDEGRLHVVLFVGVDADDIDCLYAPLDIVYEGCGFAVRPASPNRAEHGEGGNCDKKLGRVLPPRGVLKSGAGWRVRPCYEPMHEACAASTSVSSTTSRLGSGHAGRLPGEMGKLLLTAEDGSEFQVLAYHRPTCSFVPTRRFRRTLSPRDNDDTQRGGVVLLNADLCLEWQWSKSWCKVVLRETSWGVPCSSILRLELPASAIGTAPSLLPGTSWSRPPFLATVLWQTRNAVFSTPLSVPSLRASNAVGALAEVPFNDVDESNNSKAKRSPQNDGLILAAAVVTDDRDRQLCRSLLHLCHQPSRGEAASVEPNAFLNALRQQKNGRNEIENGICRFLRSGILQASSSLVSFVIQFELERAAECCCTDPGIHERDIVRLLRWRPEVFLPVVLRRTPHLSKPLLIQAFQELLVHERGQHLVSVLQMLQRLLSWLELYSNAASQEDGQKTEKAPSLDLLLDFVAVLADAELPKSFKEGTNETEVSGPEHQERVVFSKILRRVHDLMQQEDGAVLRKLEGHLLAVLTSGQALNSGEAAVGHSLVNRVTVSLRF